MVKLLHLPHFTNRGGSQDPNQGRPFQNYKGNLGCMVPLPCHDADGDEGGVNVLGYVVEAPCVVHCLQLHILHVNCTP